MENDFAQTQQTGIYNNPQPLTTLPNATAVLVLGIISIVGSSCYGVVGLICGIIALVLAKSDLALLNANPQQYTNDLIKNLRAGRVCAIVGVAVSAVCILVIIGYLVIFGTMITAILSHPQLFNH
jgi:hypothetical protein